MIQKYTAFVIFLLSGLVMQNAFATLPNVTDQGKPFPTLAPMLKKVNPAVVNISTFSMQSS